MAVLVFSWAYRAADGRRHDFTFLNQGTFFLKWGTFFLLFLTFPYFSLLSTKIKVVHTQGGTQNTNRHTPPIRFKSGGEDESPAHLPLGTLRGTDPGKHRHLQAGHQALSYFPLLSKDRKRQEKTGKGARKNAREKKQESRLQPARGVRVRGPAPLTRALPYHTRP